MPTAFVASLKRHCVEDSSAMRRRKAIIGCSDQGSEYAEPGQLPSRLEIPVRREYGCIKRKTAVTAQTDWEPHRNYPDERYLVEHPNRSGIGGLDYRERLSAKRLLTLAPNLCKKPIL
jgi:hypothetical protein